MREECNYIDSHRYMDYYGCMTQVQSSNRKATACSRSDCGDERYFEGLDRAARLFKALADETRLAILRQLRDQSEVCACDFVACCERAQPTVSHHLRVLREAGLVRAEKRGVWVYYTLAEEGVRELRALLP